MTHGPNDTDGRTDRFSEVDIDRRDFVRLAAATAGALALPGNAAADVSSERMTAEYEYVVNHTPADFAVPTLVTFADESGLSEFEALVPNAVTTTEPRPAGYARLTATEAEAAADIPTAEELSHSPGSNPFWRLGYYPFGVFPEPERSVDFVDYEQLIDGLKRLESEHGDRLRVYSIGRSPGHYNELSARPDPKGVYVAEVTNDVDDADAFREKEKVFYSLSLHGLERAGAEAGSRYVERLLRGEDPEIERLLDDVVLIFCYTNPDGWVAKHPQYESGWQLLGPDEGVPVVPFYERGNAGVYDTNRQYPTVGWISPAHYPGEPDDPADRSLERVTDALAIVEHFRGYENLNYGADLHGMLNSKEFVLGLISQDQFDVRALHELYGMNRVIDETLEEALSTWVTAADFQEEITGGFNPAPLGFGTLPEQAYDYSTIWDTIGYTVSGAMGDWMAHPEELGGLGMTTMDFEMAYSHMTGSNAFNPELVEMQVTGYVTAVRTIADFAVRNSDTPNTDDEFEAAVETGGESTAYVVTDSLTRSSEDLSFASSDGPTFTYGGLIGPGVTGAEERAEHTFHTDQFAEPPTRVEASLSWTPDGQDLEFYLEDPAGDRIAAAETANNPETIATSLDAEGEYAFVVETWANAASEYEIEATFPGAETETTTSASVQSERVEALGALSTAFEVAGGLHTLSVHVHAHEALLRTELVAPSGDVARAFDPDAGEHAAGGRCCSGPEWTVREPEAGTWTVRVENLIDAAEQVDVRVATLASSGPHPDPEEALGYEQRPYEVTPLRFFEDYADAVADGGAVDPVTVDEVKAGALSDYDNAVLIHDDAAHDGEYVAALDAFVGDGGNLVLTDAGVRLLGAMENDLANAVSPGDVTEERFYVAHLGEKDLDHPLLEDARPVQKALWKIAPLGYSTGNEAPMSVVDEEAFRLAAASGDAVPSIAATTGGAVSAGSLTRSESDGTGIHVIGGLLPPASQANLHPFGLLDYTTSFLGYLALTNALGFRQVRRTADGERAFGGGPFEVEGEEPPFTVDGSREDDGSTFTGGQTNRVELAVTPSLDAAVRDAVPAEWTVLTEHSDDVTRIEDAGDVQYVYFGTAAADETARYSYLVETPEGLTETNVYEFGPVEVSVDGDRWTPVDGTEDENAVAGVST
ncbi:M14 family zinc carboxypeptidase [Halegenticoccus soli]|uniref:M14 family zinc carboxypeptidase n=1 Tax=Halegenticoccus soli TaxID=1985678 RepID=UPI000C6DC77C|nr:M14 family zinc carboxypeptidase [Halegenticoccus soli]